LNLRVRLGIISSRRDQRATRDQKLDAVKNATKASWNDAKAGFQKGHASVKSSGQDAWQWLKEKASS
jgi:hypothetical protein